MSKQHSSRLITRYQDAERLYRLAGYAPIPVNPNSKKPMCKDWANLTPSEEQIADRLQKFPNANTGLLAGTWLAPDRRLGFADIDYDPIVPFVLKVVGPGPAKRGAKGRTLFVAVPPMVRSFKILGSNRHPMLEVFANSGQVVIPDSIHPLGMRYEWLGQPLLEIDHQTLPLLDDAKIAILKAVLENESAQAIIEGGASVKAHELMLRLTSSGVANLTDDLDWLTDCLSALFHPDYSGNTRDEIREMLESAKKKGLGACQMESAQYDAGEDGPVPMGYSKDGSYVVLDPVRKIIILCSAYQLLSEQFLVGLAPSHFWQEQFPKKRGGFDSKWAGEALIAACKKRGPFSPLRVRGRGVWREGDRVIVNFGTLIEGAKNLYLCFEPIELDAQPSFDASRLLRLLQAFNWRNPQDAMLLFGWLALAPICGVLSWRPHAFVYGPARSGKTTIHSIATTLLSPLVISADGQSSEAGIRQSLGPDSLPIVIDEFESDQNGSRLQAVVRLARSASSAESPVLKGTPEGKAMTFSLRASFFFAAINPRGLSPADQTRIMMLELLMHQNDREKARFIQEEEAWIRSMGSAWCSHMIANAGLIHDAIERLDLVLGSVDRRVRQNFATLLGGAWVALNGRAPSPEEAEALADEYQPAVDRHTQETERDDAQECLDFLLAHLVEKYPLGHWLARDRDQKNGLKNLFADHARIVAMHDMIVEIEGERPGLLIGHGSPVIEEVFKNTRWGGNAWQRALHKLAGAFTLEDPLRFPSGRRSRVVGIPLAYLPEKPLPIPENSKDF